MTLCQLKSNQLESDGYAIASGVLDCDAIEELRHGVERFSHRPNRRSDNARRLLEHCAPVARLASSRLLRELVDPVLGSGAFAVRGILFDKTDGANWRVGWHQDQMIPVVEQVETLGFTAWSTKLGVTHVRPPAEVLEGMLTLRIHVDDCPAENGPLLVLPGTHRLGIVSEDLVRDKVAGRTPQSVWRRLATCCSCAPC